MSVRTNNLGFSWAETRVVPKNSNKNKVRIILIIKIQF
jgi:hypothetical protein